MARYFNSSEPGMTLAENPDLYFADSFDRTYWYETDDDPSNSINFGWRGYAQSQSRSGDGDAPATNVSSGIWTTKCATNGGSPAAGTQGSGWAAWHDFYNATEVSELYFRCYFKIVSPGVDDITANYGHTKLFEFEGTEGNPEEVGWLFSAWGAGELDWHVATGTPDTNTTADGAAGIRGCSDTRWSGTHTNKAPDNGGTNTVYDLTLNTWHYVECRWVMESAVNAGDGQIWVWADDCGSDGLTAPGNGGQGTLRMFYDDIYTLQDSGHTGISTVYFEWWNPSTASGLNTGEQTVYFDEAVASSSRIYPYGVWDSLNGGGSISKGTSFSYFR